LQSVAFTPGTGKTHLAIGLAMRACQAGHRVLFATAAEWVARLAEAHHAGRIHAELTRLGRYPLLVVDLYRSRNYAEVQVTFSERLCGGGSLVNWGCAVVGMITGIPGMPAPRPWAGSALVVWRPGR